MFILLLISNVLALSSTSEQKSAGFFNGAVNNRNNFGQSNIQSIKKPLIYNTTYFDKADNLLRIPNKYYEEQKVKKIIKKNPKRTVQKIIKKNKFKTRKLYVYPATMVPTPQSKSLREEYTREVTPTTESNMKKKVKKNLRYIRYPMPFQKLQKKDVNHNRYRREDRDILILKNLDEIKFLSSEKDHDKFVAHIQKYW